MQHKELLSSSIDPNLNITFQGLSTFRNQVVYVDLLKDEHYNNLIQFQSKHQFLNIKEFKQIVYFFSPQIN